MASNVGLMITGSVQCGAAPVPGAPVRLIPAAGPNDPAPVMATMTNADGFFAFDHPPVGEWRVQASLPEYPAETASSQRLRVQPGQWVDAGCLQPTRPLRLAEPGQLAALETLTPTLRWEHVPEAASYTLFVADEASGTLSLRQTTPSNSLRVDPPLLPGHWYIWVVTAFLATGEAIASSPAGEFQIIAAAEG